MKFFFTPMHQYLFIVDGSFFRQCWVSHNHLPRNISFKIGLWLAAALQSTQSLGSEDQNRKKKKHLKQNHWHKTGIFLSFTFSSEYIASATFNRNIQIWHKLHLTIAAVSYCKSGMQMKYFQWISLPVWNIYWILSTVSLIAKKGTALWITVSKIKL